MTPEEKLDKVFEAAMFAATDNQAEEGKVVAGLLKVALDAAAASAELEGAKRAQKELADALREADPEVAANLEAVLDAVKKRRALVKAVA